MGHGIDLGIDIGSEIAASDAAAAVAFTYTHRGLTDGSDEYWTIPHEAQNSFNLDTVFSFEIETEFVSSGIQYIVSKGDTNSNRMMILRDGASRLRFRAMGTGTDMHLRQTTGSVGAQDTKFHIVITNDGSGTAGGLTVYINGSPTAMTTVSSTFAGTIEVATPWQVGRAQSNLFGNLRAGWLAVYNIELTSGQVTSRHNGGFGWTDPELELFGGNVVLNSNALTDDTTAQFDTSNNVGANGVSFNMEDADRIAA